MRTSERGTSSGSDSDWHRRCSQQPETLLKFNLRDSKVNDSSESQMLIVRDRGTEREGYNMSHEYKYE